jgi:hypothetical protein
MVSLFVSLFSCTKNDAHTPDPFADFSNTGPVGFLRNGVNMQNTVHLNVIKNAQTSTIDIDTVNITVKLSRPLAADLTATVKVDEGLLADYNTAHNTAYKLLPAATYSFKGGDITIPKGATASGNLELKITDIGSMVSGETYLLPIRLTAASNAEKLTIPETFKTIYVVIGAADKPVFPSTEKGPYGIKSVLYVEVKASNPLNAGRYVLKTSGKPLFDLVMLFGAGMGWTNKKPTVTLGPAYGPLNDVNKYVRPLQQKGIKVLMGFLGATQNYSLDEIELISQQIKQIIVQYDLDGVNFDDEYQQYDGIVMPKQNDFSYTMLIKRCKELMPDKLVTLYDIGTRPKNVGSVSPGDYLDYAWQAYYGSYGAPVIPGLTDKKKLGPGAFWIGNSGQSSSGTLASRTVTDGYGVLVYYDLTAEAQTSDLQPAALALYQDSVITTGPAFTKDY